MYRAIKFTGSLSQDCTITIGPNNRASWFIIENAAGDDVILSQGSGANVTVQNGKNVIVYCDGAGSGAAVVDALADLQIGTLEVTGATAIDGQTTFSSTVLGGADDAGVDVKFHGDTASRYWLWDTSADGVVQRGTLTVGVDDTGYDVKLFGAASGSYLLWDESADDLILAGAAGLSVAGGSVLTGVTTHGGNVVSDADSTDDLGTTSVRWANLFVDGITATDQITATGFTGTLDGILGSGAAAAATVTTLTASGIASIDDTTDTTSGTTGSIHTDGGVGVAKALYVGTTSKLVGVTTHGDDVVSDTDSTDDLGTTSVRWANLFVDAITATDQITATGFTGTLDGILGSGTPAAATVTTAQLNGALTVGVDDTGHDVKFFGAASGSYMLWDESTDDLILGGAARLGIGETAPAYELDVVGNARLNPSSNPVLRLSEGGTLRSLITASSSLGFSIEASGDKPIVMQTNGVERMRIDGSGAVTQPLQPAFCGYVSSSKANVTGNAVAYTVVYDGETIDQGADFATSTFTAPVAGSYLLTFRCTLSEITPTNTDGYIRIVTSNRNYDLYFDPGKLEAGSAYGLATAEMTVFADMDASDTATTLVTVNQGAQTVDVHGTSTTEFTTFSGYLVA
jgi:hypothetical protein